MVNRFDTTPLNDRERVDHWMDIIRRYFPHAAGQRVDAQSFSAQLQRTVLGPVELSDIRCSQIRYERRTQEVRTDAAEEMLVSYMLEGEARLEQGGRVANLGAGDIALYDAARPFVYDFGSPYRMLLAKVPRRVLLSRLPDAERLTAIRISGASKVGSLASTVLSSAVAIDVPQDTVASIRLGTSMVDILASAIEMELDAQGDLRDRQAQLLKKAKDYIRAHLDDTELDVDQVALALHVSTRTLSRAFASEGISVIKWLWQERLETSYVTLSEGRATQVLDVVAGCGFSSRSHFSRLFKARYGVLPHTFLRLPSTSH
jgi:AraC family transcriptional activator of tynA and feaB